MESGTAVTTPPMPTSQDEWEIHWAFYQLTIAQRDSAWREVELLRAYLPQDGSVPR